VYYYYYYYYHHHHPVFLSGYTEHIYAPEGLFPFIKLTVNLLIY